MTNYTDISDNEIRIIGEDSFSPTSTRPAEVNNPGGNNYEPENNHNKWKWLALALIFGIILVFFIIVSLLHTSNKRIVVEEVIDTLEISRNITETAEPEPDIQASLNITEDTINDIKIYILTPEGCKAELQIGQVDTLDKSVVLCAQAADIRGDNGEIVSAYVLKGEPKSRGVAKKGFCAILDGAVTLGMSEETPLYERVVESQGDFFRQYPLVHDSQMQENKPKGKARRNALCILNGKVCIISSDDKESFHDFAQALQDYGVTEAISLTGSEATLFGRTNDGKLHNFGLFSNIYPNLNYIIFRK